MRIREKIPLSRFNTFEIGGKARYFCTPRNTLEYKEAVLFAKEKGVRFLVLGGGANILFSDGLVNRFIISTRKWDKIIKIDEDKILFGAGVTIEQANRFLIRKGLSGMEFSGGLPGTMGGAVYMNARCYGHEFSEIVERVVVIDDRFRLREISKEELQYGYKQSLFMSRPELCIKEVVLRVVPKNKKEILIEYRKNVQDRKEKGQYLFPSAGCVFKNDYQRGIPAGKLIEEVGLKGAKVGTASVYEKHANFVVNRGGAKAEDVKKLLEEIRKKVYQEKGVVLELELQIVD